MGILDTYSNSNFGGGSIPTYTTIAQVRRAYDDNKLTYSAAYRILMGQFGLSDLDIQDVLIIEEPDFIGPIPLDPGLVDEIPDTNPETQEAESGVMPITDDQRFLIIGLAVAAALFGFIKR